MKAMIAVVGILIGSASCGWAQKEPSVIELRGALESTVRALDSCHVVGAFRGFQESPGESAASKPRVTFVDLWLSGDHAQIRMTQSVGDDQRWWEDRSFTPLKAPLTAADVDKKPGLKACYRPSGDFRWAESRLVDPKSTPDFNSLYSRSQGRKPPQVVDLPLIQLNRAWEVDNQGAWLAVNFLVEAPAEAWRVIGTETVGGRKKVVIEVPQGQVFKAKLERHEGDLEVTPIWKAWFSTDSAEGYFPTRIELGVRYKYGGKEYAHERPANVVRSTNIFEAKDIKRFADGLYYPTAGTQESYLPRPEASAGFDPDKIVDQFLRDGKYVDDTPYSLTTRREWRVLELETIPPATRLWIEPPTDACVLDVDTNTRFISGVTEVESRKRLGLDTNQAESLTPRRPSMFFWAAIVVNLVIAALLVVRFVVFRKKSP